MHYSIVVVIAVLLLLFFMYKIYSSNKTYIDIKEIYIIIDYFIGYNSGSILEIANKISGIETELCIVKTNESILLTIDEDFVPLDGFEKIKNNLINIGLAFKENIDEENFGLKKIEVLFEEKTTIKLIENVSKCITAVFNDFTANGSICIAELTGRSEIYRRKEYLEIMSKSNILKRWGRTK